jgi:hypothetical protein
VICFAEVRSLGLVKVSARRGHRDIDGRRKELEADLIITPRPVLTA